MNWRRNPALVPHKTHGHYKLDSWRFRWLLARQTAADLWWWTLQGLRLVGVALLWAAFMLTCGKLLALGASL
jgi:hypothetical protein